MASKAVVTTAAVAAVKPVIAPAALQPREVSLERATLYYLGGFGIKRVECRTLRVRLVKFAQYASAVEVYFIEKGKRTPRGTKEGHDPRIVVLAGWGHFEPPSALDRMPDDGSGTVCERSRFTSFAPEWVLEMDRLIDAHLAKHPQALVADYRGRDCTQALEG